MNEMTISPLDERTAAGEEKLRKRKGYVPTLISMVLLFTLASSGLWGVEWLIANANVNGFLERVGNAADIMAANTAKIVLTTFTIVLAHGVLAGLTHQHGAIVRKVVIWIASASFVLAAWQLRSVNSTSLIIDLIGLVAADDPTKALAQALGDALANIWVLSICITHLVLERLWIAYSKLMEHYANAREYDEFRSDAHSFAVARSFEIAQSMSLHRRAEDAITEVAIWAVKICGERAGELRSAALSQAASRPADLRHLTDAQLDKMADALEAITVDDIREEILRANGGRAKGV